MKCIFPIAAIAAVLSPAAMLHAADAVPFNQKVEVYREKQGDVIVFIVRLEQPFLAEEFEKSNYLRLHSSDDRAYLIYPKEMTFQQKHAEFYGRLRGKGTVKLKLDYEIVSENPDGSRHVETRQGQIEVPIPAEPTGLPSLYRQWAEQQDIHLANRLRYYPEDSFSQYVLLQSAARYDVAPPALPLLRHTDKGALESDLYQIYTGSTAIQEALQRAALGSSPRGGDLTVPISNLSPPELTSLPYKDLLEQKRTRDKIEPKVAEIARLVPADQYLLQLNSMQSLDDLLDLSTEWGGSLLRLYTIEAQDQRLRQKLEEQLCLRRDALTKLFADAAISDVAFTGADPFVHEGADVTVILRVKQPALFEQAAGHWLADARKAHSDLVEAEFNYHGHKVSARYTPDRGVSSFVVRHDDYVIYSNSHRAIRRAIDTAAGASPALYDSLDYRYVTTILPPTPTANAGYFYVPEAMVRRLIGPAAKISEKRRLECDNNLVMLNNASMFYRMEYGHSPRSLADLVQGRFIDPKIVCPHGGAYAYDPARDACTCSLHNRLKYLTPNIELGVLTVSQQEAAEYERYKQRYQGFWQGIFDPIAVRITVDRTVKLETCVLPMANGSLYNDLRAMVDKTPRPLSTARIAPSALVSLAYVPGRKAIGERLRAVPGVEEVLRANPTLTDLSWLGDRVSVHFCDGDSILQVDPAELHSLQLPYLGDFGVPQQGLVAAVVMALKMPCYATIDVENRDQAAKLLQQLSKEVVVQGADLGGLRLSADAYRLPDYKGQPIYVFAVELYAIKLRLHVAVVGDQLVVATKPELLREVIDAAARPEGKLPPPAHALVRFNRRGLDRACADARLYWEEKARAACHRNVSAIYNLVKLYGVPIDDVPRLSEAKYGVRYFCPDGGEYRYDAQRDEVVCGVHGNREHSHQNPRPDRQASFARFIEDIDEVRASLRFQDDALLTTVEIVRSAKKP